MAMTAKLHVALLAVVLCFAAVSVGGVQAAASPESSAKACKVVKHGKKKVRSCRTVRDQTTTTLPKSSSRVVMVEDCLRYQPRWLPGVLGRC
jgi:hypothetical protein